MNQKSHHIDLAFLAPFAIFAVSVTALVNAYTAEYALGLEPCILCLYQRVPYAAASVLGLAALFVPSLRSRAVAVAGMVFLAGAVLAFYHVGVEQHWWVSVASCGGGGNDGPATVEELRQLLMRAKPVKACDEVDWTLFGLSMATYNAALSLVLGSASLWAADQLRRSK